MSTNVGSNVKLGFNLENLYEDDIIYTSGVNVIDEDDEVPDIIPIYGYLDDISVVNWILQEIENDVLKI